jgi:predicted lipid-binding transport protein (Tim44 family)
MKFTSIVLTLFMALTSLHADAAKRMGGGKSFGQQSGNVTQREATRPAPGAAPNAASSPSPASAAAPRRPWGAMLGGLAAGLGLAWLAHSLGFGSEFGQILMFGLLAMLAVGVIGYFMRRRATATPSPYAYGGSGGSSINPGNMPQYNPAKVGNDASARPWEQTGTNFDSTPARSGVRIGSSLMGGSPNWFIPADFDVQAFVSAANSMLHEIQTQLAERGQLVQGPNLTEVVMIEAQLLGIEDLGEGYMASIEFSGMIREEPNTSPSPFREVWNMTKPKTGEAGWLVAGVQALQ